MKLVRRLSEGLDDGENKILVKELIDEVERVKEGRHNSLHVVINGTEFRVVVLII